MFMDDVPSFFQFLDKHLELDNFIPDDFSMVLYRSLERKRIYPLNRFLSALILQKIFPTQLTFDTSGMELYVSENNPKTLNSLIRRLKSYYKDKPEVDLYKMAYGLMPSLAASSPDAKQQYINDHFCYVGFKQAHPEMLIDKKSDSPDEDKSIGDSSSLKPALSDFFALHPHFQPDTFLGDSAFDTIDSYRFLRNDFHFS